MHFVSFYFSFLFHMCFHICDCSKPIVHLLFFPSQRLHLLQGFICLLQGCHSRCWLIFSCIVHDAVWHLDFALPAAAAHSSNIFSSPPFSFRHFWLMYDFLSTATYTHLSRQAQISALDFSFRLVWVCRLFSNFNQS